MLDAPVGLASLASTDDVLRELTTRQAAIGQAPGAKGGNSRRRIKLALNVPGFGPHEADHLAAELARPPGRQPQAFLFTWNPDKWDWPPEQFAQAVQVTGSGQVWPEPWSAGNRTSGVGPGDHAFLLRQHRDRGIVASGIIQSGLYGDAHWDGSGRSASYAQIAWATVVEPEDRVAVEILKASIPEIRWDRLEAGGVHIPGHLVEPLLDLWSKHVEALSYRSPEELPPGETFPEGALDRRLANRYERDPRARQIALRFWGTRCSACEVDFAERYGEIGDGFIHVHHLRELSQVAAGYRVDPVNDLRPVCPNCHAMLHRRQPSFTIEELRQLIRQPQPG